MRKYADSRRCGHRRGAGPAEHRPGRPDPVDHREPDAGEAGKKKFKPAQIYVEILTGPNTTDPTNPEQPPSAINTKVNFPKNAKFDPKAVAAVQGRPRRSCRTRRPIRPRTSAATKSIVSKGSTAPTGPESARPAPRPGSRSTCRAPGTTLGVPVVVTAFNGTKKNTLFLHSRADSVNNTSVLVGKLKTGKKAPKGYGSQLDVTIPPLLAGAISRFTTTVKNGKYVQARCKTKNEKWQAITHVRQLTSPTATDDYT